MGEITDPSVKIIRAPNNTRKKKIGASHHFLRTLRKSQISDSIENFDKVCSQLFDFN
jgi:hypothetical protein